MKKLSVVIPAYNEEKTIRKCLNSFVNQTTSASIEVIVVDNNSTDQTVAIAEEFRDKLDLKIVHEQKKGRSPARKAGFEAAHGEIIFSTDADACVPKDWVQQLIEHFDNPKISAVSGTCYIDDCSWRINTSFNIFQPLSMIFYRTFIGHFWLSGFNFAIRNDVYKKSGGFNPNLNIQEDTDLAMRVSKIGTIKFIRKPTVLFSGRRFKTGLIRGLFPYVKSYFTFFILKREKDTFLSDVR